MKGTVEKLEGKVTKITLRLEGGLTVEQDGKWKKYAIAPEMTVSVGSEDDFEEQAAALEAHLSAWIGKYLKPIEEHYTAPSVAQHAQQSTPKATPQPQQSGLLDSTSKTFVVETLSVSITGGKRYMKAKGGHFKMYGVNVWEEVAAMPPLEWDLATLDGADYAAPEGLTAIYVEKTLDSGKVVPDKVTGWL